MHNNGRIFRTVQSFLIEHPGQVAEGIRLKFDHHEKIRKKLLTTAGLTIRLGDDNQLGRLLMEYRDMFAKPNTQPQCCPTGSSQRSDIVWRCRPFDFEILPPLEDGPEEE